jgi:hypothetical protein
MKLTMPSKQDVVLPPVREDIRIIAGGSSADGSPRCRRSSPWKFSDRRAYHPIRWSAQTAEAILAEIHADTTCRATKQDVETLFCMPTI